MSSVIDSTVKIGEGTQLVGECVLRGSTIIGKNCLIQSSYITDSVLEDDVTVGPFAHIRAGCTVKKGAKVGSFVEIKNTALGADARVPHLSYLGDATVGEGANIGCGAITANYDGENKHATVIGNRAFIGCNSVLIAPANIGDDAYVAANSAITQDVPCGALAISRVKGVTIKLNYRKKP